MTDSADFLYGEANGKELPAAFDDLEDYAVLAKWKADAWVSLLNK
jgi:hypothetical protein